MDIIRVYGIPGGTDRQRVMAKLLLAFWWCTVGLLATIAIDANPDEDLYATEGACDAARN